MDQSQITAIAATIINEVEKVIIGKRDVIEKVVTCLLAEGHVLLEDVPGLGKTMLSRALSTALGGQFTRVQFTPDLLPSDITGSLVFDPRSAEFTYRQGPVVTNILLADEINRSGPRTQSSLLEAMEERQVSVERERIALPRPFFVLATQNPIELEGTFPLPEAQLDRFLMRLSIGYPAFDDEREMLRRFRENRPLDSVSPVTSPEEITSLIEQVRLVHISDDVENYLLEIIRATREADQLEVGASPRAAIALTRAAQAYAAVHGYNFVRPDDVREMAKVVLPHRVVITPDADLLGKTTAEIIAQVIGTVEVPVEDRTAV